MTFSDHGDILKAIFDVAVAACQAEICLPRHFPEALRNGRLIVLSTGKAGAAMAETAEKHYAGLIESGGFLGLSTTRKGYGKNLRATELIEASHPVPDRNSTQAAEKALGLARQAGENDMVLALISGGASALWAAPVAGVSLAEKQNLTRTLLKVGATIGEINCVRKHLSRIKGGRLAEAAMPARLVTLAISDVPGDAPDVIGSGPTVPDHTTLADARAVLERFRIEASDAVRAALADAANETPKPSSPAFAASEFVIAAKPKDALEAAARKVKAFGYEPILLGDALEGEARDIASEHATLALEVQSQGRRAAILSGGELTVTISGDGRGGPNQEYALALALALNGAPGIYALAADTDGSDGGAGRCDDPAGAIVSPKTLQKAENFTREAKSFLLKNDSTAFFEMVDDLIVSGPTYTNVNDLRVILVEPR